MEELVLTEPVVEQKTTDKYKVVSLNLDWEARMNPTDENGLIMIALRDNNGEKSHYSYHGQEAIDMMKWMNTADFTTNSMHKRLLQKLSNDGSLPGTVTGTPDPPTGEL